MRAFRVLTVALIALFARPLAAQQYFFKNYSVESGLPFIQVACMFQDSNGYLWSGGYGGLSRFDGKTFVNFNRKNGLIDHNVNAIAASATGDIFVGTNRGMSVLRGRKFTNFSGFGNIVNPNITSFCRGYHHSMYIGTTAGLFMFRNEAVSAVKKLEGYAVNCLYNPDSNVIFIGTNRGLVVYGHSTFRLLNTGNGLPSRKVTCITRFGGSIAIGTTRGLCLLDLKTGRVVCYGAANGLFDEEVTSLEAQGNDNLWIGTPSGLLNFDGRQFTYYNIDGGNNSNQVLSLLHDREHNLWIGTHSGLYRYRDKSFSTYDRIPGLASSLIFQIFRDRKGYLWVTSQNNGIYRLRNDSVTRFGPREGLLTNTSHSGIEDREGRLLFGSDSQLVRLQNNRLVDVGLQNGWRGPVEVLYEGTGGTVWIGGGNGFSELRFKGGDAVTRFHPIRAGNEFSVYGFCEDDSGRLYIGTFKAGLHRLSNDTVENLTERLGLNEQTFFTLRYMNGLVFAASLNGVLVLNTRTNTLTRISDLDGLNSELVYSLEFSRDRRYLWIGTNQGINRLDLADYFSKGKVTLMSFGKQEGFSGVECNSNGIWEDRDGTMWFGTVNGLIRHVPKAYSRNLVENKTVIQSIRVLNEDTMIRSGVELPSDYKSISFYFRGICLTNPDRVLYSRKLEGLDREWSEPSTEDFIRYSNLAPGHYVFKVRSCNNEGIWNAHETTFSFSISYPFYLTWWFITSMAVGVFAIIYAIFIFRVVNIKKKQKREYERRVEMSRIELKALRSQMNPHFIFNSLNAIQHYIFNTKGDEAVKYLNKFARLVRVILNNSEKPTVTVGDDIEALKLYLELEKMRFEEKFDYEVIVDPSVDLDYDIMPPLLLQPYVENAILHGLNPKPGKGKLEISIAFENNFLICTITDNGIGRERSGEIRKTMPLKKHSSMGMKITEDRLRILNELNNSFLSVTITDLKDENGQALGTRVQLFVPIIG